MSNRCTIVTCYYRSPAKHSTDDYDKWMTNFLTTVNNEMVIFCDEASFVQIQTLRKQFAEITKIIVLPLTETYCCQEQFIPYWIKDWHRDIEKHIHHPNLYVIWNEKSMFVQRVMEMNPFQTDFYCWCDIGCFRDKENVDLFRSWPSNDFLQSANHDKMYFLNITPFEEEDFKIYPSGLTRSFKTVTRIGATIFLGHHTIFKKWIQVFYNYMNRYMINDYFTGKDQNIIASIYVLHPELFKLIRPVQGEGDPWFYLQRYFLKKEAN